jgi:hypothetical protein
MNGQAIKKPVKINFYEWDNNKVGLLLWVDRVAGKEKQRLFNFEDEHSLQKTNCCTIETLEGNHSCGLGDIIIQGVSGEFYPCKRNIFNETYDVIKTKDERGAFGGTIIVSAFPGCGKSYCSRYGKELIIYDSDSSKFHFTDDN